MAAIELGLGFRCVRGTSEGGEREQGSVGVLIHQGELDGSELVRQGRRERARSLQEEDATGRR